MTHSALKGSTVSDRLEIPEEYVGYTVYDPEWRKIGRVKGKSSSSTGTTSQNTSG